MFRLKNILILMVVLTACDKQTVPQSRAEASSEEKSIIVIDNRHLQNGANALGQQESGRSMIIADAQSSVFVRDMGGIDIP
ncbi:MAG: hypothetical protein ABIQ95_06255, partial [Bdellovibrionia bacterium]